ncbi:helix-turn-helix domain-containing protein [Halorussus marinus]|uniref:helix-turn-helix domain-containing protein n=1 Tax=Halorussus marinus TaxID=2505976 RepID=UPI00106EC553|nr:helix-turn-helix domain-containing protein [Halorussus marinus]
MKRARLRVRPPRSATSPVHGAVQSTDGLGVATLLSGGIDPDDPTELFSIAGGEAAVRAALADCERVRSFDVTTVEADATYVYVREDGRDDQRKFAELFTAGTLVATLPIRYRPDGRVELTLVGASDDLRSAVERASDLAEVTVATVGDGWTGGEPSRHLTDRQHEVLEAASALGYYDNPRGATQDEVAAELDLAPSTVAEHLRKAESRLVADALDAAPE